MPASVKTNAGYIEVSCNIKNTGSKEGTEIVQLYISPNSNQPLKPIQLKGFQRVDLKPGEMKTVTFKVSSQQLAHYSDNIWRIDAGEYEFKIGASSADIRLNASCKLTGKPVKMERRTVLFAK